MSERLYGVKKGVMDSIKKIKERTGYDFKKIDSGKLILIIAGILFI